MEGDEVERRSELVYSQRRGGLVGGRGNRKRIMLIRQATVAGSCWINESLDAYALTVVGSTSMLYTGNKKGGRIGPKN